MTQVKTMNTLVKGLQVAAAVSIAVLAANPAYAALIKVIDAGTKIYSPDGQWDINRKEPVETYDSVLWYEDSTDKFAPPQEGNVVISDSLPSDISDGASDGPFLQIFGEQWDLELPDDVWINTPNDWWGPRVNQIPKGTRINSYYMFIDAYHVSADGSPIELSGREFWNLPPEDKEGIERRWVNGFGTFVFEEDILGLIGHRKLQFATDDIFARPGITYEETPGWSGMEGTANKKKDLATIEGNEDCNACVLKLNFSTRDSADTIRVITKSTNYADVPEPLTILGSGAALGFIPLLKRASSKKKKKAE